MNYIVNRTWISNVTVNHNNVYINCIANMAWLSNVIMNNDNVYINYIVNRSWISNVTIKMITFRYIILLTGPGFLTLL